VGGNNVPCLIGLNLVLILAEVNPRNSSRQSKHGRMVEWSTNERPMAQIPGRLIVDMFSDGMVRMVFLPHTGDGNASPLTAKDLDAAEVLFITCGLTPERAAALRAEVNRNEVASVDTSVDVRIAAKFRYTRP